MKPPSFDYIVPDSLEEALAVLSEHGDAVKILAGGQSLMPLLNFRLVRPQILCDINRIAALTGRSQGPTGYRMGALTRHQQLAEDAWMGDHLPIWQLAARHIGHLAIRSRGTLGGSLAHADPAAELPTVALLDDVHIVVQSTRGERRVAAAQFFRSYLSTALEPDELVVAVEVSKPAGNPQWAWVEQSRRSGDFALVGVGVRLSLDDQGHITDTRVALAGVAATPMRCPMAEAALMGQVPGPRVFHEAGACAAESTTPLDDMQASAAYRRHLVHVLVPRALAQAEAGDGGRRRGRQAQ